MALEIFASLLQPTLATCFLGVLQPAPLKGSYFAKRGPTTVRIKG